MNNFTIGKYLPLDSFVHKLDPRTKIIMLLLIMGAVFIKSGWIGYFIILGFIALSLILSKIKISYVLNAFKPLIMMMVFLIVINVLVIKEGNLIFSYGFIKIYDKAILDTLYISVRLLIMISASTILTMSSNPLDLTVGIEKLLKPLGRFNFPYEDVAMMISIALRFIPTIIEETQKIMNAQRSRGVDYEEGKIKEKIQAVLSLIVPLFSTSLNMAEDLASAMEARGYIPQEPRTRYRYLKYNIKDYIVFLIGVLLVVLLVWVSYYAI